MTVLPWSRIEAFTAEVVTSDGRVDNLAARLAAVWRSVREAGSPEEIIRFGLLLAPLNDGRGERWGLYDLLYQINAAVAEAAEAVGEHVVAGRFWHDQGQMLHRKGFTRAALEVFQRSAQDFERGKAAFQQTESIFMTALCYRALGDVSKAKAVLTAILAEVEGTSWRANPLNVLAWLERDEGNYAEAERLFVEAISLLAQEATSSSQLVLAQTLTDLGELNTRMQLYDKAEQNFLDSIARLKALDPVDTRQLVRSYLKLSKLMRKRQNLKECDRLLKEAVAILEITQHHELAARAQVELGIVCLQRFQLISALKHLGWAWFFWRGLGSEGRHWFRTYLFRFLFRMRRALSKSI